jgi:8-oxo-dGTP pyrophosphatase MutT (NUDIX family)
VPPARFFHRDPKAPAPNRPIGVGALALIERENKLLMELRSDCERWGLPGGAVEADEAIEEALRREVFEETGLVASEYELFGIFTDPSRIVEYPDGNVVRLLSFVYRVAVENFAPLRASEESLEFRFFDEHSLRVLDVVETARPVIEAYLSSAAPRTSIVAG